MERAAVKRLMLSRIRLRSNERRRKRGWMASTRRSRRRLGWRMPPQDLLGRRKVCIFNEWVRIRYFEDKTAKEG